MTEKNKSKHIAEAILLLILILGTVLMIRLRAPSRKDVPEASSTPEVVEPTPEPTPTPVPTVLLGGKEYAADTASLTLDASVNADELSGAIGEFSALAEVDASACGFTDEEKRQLLAGAPDLRYLWTVELDGREISNTETSLTIPSPEMTESYAAKADLLPDVLEISLEGGDYTPEQAGALAEAWPSAAMAGQVSLFGQSFSLDEEELDFSDTKIRLEETEQFTPLIAAMPNLKKVIMSDCGIGNEEMEALNLSHETVQFVWTVYFKVYSVRTDTDHFCASDLRSNGYVCWPMTQDDFAPLKYCHDLVALDVGHENVYDLSFVYDMPKLRFLILATVHNELDLSPLASLQDLYYLEVFHNPIKDLTPLLECKNLRHLNIGNCSGDFSIEPLKEMTYLTRLWFPMNHLSEEEKASLVEALPDTDVYLGSDDEVGGTWRKDEYYKELKEALCMPVF